MEESLQLSQRNPFGSAIASLWRLWHNQPDDLDKIHQASNGLEQEGWKYFRRGRAEMRAGDSAAASKEFDRALSRLPDFADAVAARAEVLDVQGGSAAARGEYERARQMNSATRPGAPDRSYVFRRPGRFAFEIDAYDFVIRHKSDSTLLFIARGNALLAQGRSAEALENYERAFKLKPNLPEVSALKGEALSAMGRYEESLAAFDAALAAHSKDTETLNGRAIACMALRRVDEANEDFRRQFELLSGEHVSARAYVALRMADYQAALPEIECALAKKPTDPYWQLYRHTALRRLNRSNAPIEVPAGSFWPVPLLAFHAGRISEEEVLRRADTNDRRAEAAFQFAVAASTRDRHTLEKRWKEVVESGAPALIEYAAAQNELSRLGE